MTAGVLLAAAAPAAGLAQRWTVVPSPDRGSATSFNTLGRVSCVPARACVAVGYYVDHAGKIRTLAEAWNGTAWSLTPSVNKGSGVNGSVLIGVSCTAATACVAVGSYSDAAQIYRTLGESWNGRTWTVIPTPDAGQPSGNNSLNGVSCVSARACSAVGWYQRARRGVQQTLAEILERHVVDGGPHPGCGRRPQRQRADRRVVRLGPQLCRRRLLHQRSELPDAGRVLERQDLVGGADP